jgi:hypothetical protein
VVYFTGQPREEIASLRWLFVAFDLDGEIVRYLEEMTALDTVETTDDQRIG